MLMAKIIVKFLNELFCVVVDWVASQHWEAYLPVIEAHVVKELCKDHTERAQSVALIWAEELWVSLKYVFVHLKDHLFILTILLESVLVLSFKQIVFANGDLVRVLLKLE